MFDRKNRQGSNVLGEKERDEIKEKRLGWVILLFSSPLQ